MSVERMQHIVGLIAAHPDREVVGRTRLQKEVKLLQRVGFPTDYSYTIHFYGPYSESLQADIDLLDSVGWIKERSATTLDGKPYFILQSLVEFQVPPVSAFQGQVERMAAASAVALELAATYDAFRESGNDHAIAMERLRRKKASKCTEQNVREAFELLADLKLSGGSEQRGER